MKLKKETRGRPRIPKKMKVQSCNFTVSPEVSKKIAKIQNYSRSKFFCGLLEAVPASWIAEYNRVGGEFFPIRFPE